MVPDQHIVELLPVFHRLRRAEQIGDPDVGQVPARLEQFDVGIREGPEELAPPGPGATGQRLLGSTTITFAPSTRKSCRTKPSQRLSTPGNGFGASAGATAIKGSEIMCNGGDHRGIPSGPGEW